MSRSYPNADAVSAAIAALLPADARQLSAIEQEDGSYVVSGTDAALAKLDAGPSKDRLNAYLSDKRWQLETGGYSWNGHLVATDRDSRSIIGQERQAITLGERADPDGFKMGGVLVMVSNADFIVMSNAVRAFVRACFAVEGVLAAGINAGTITSIEEIDAAAWPA